MINLLLLSFFCNLVTSLLAEDEVNTLPLESSPTLGSYQKSPLPQLNLEYDGLTPDTNRFEYSQPLQNFEKDNSTYCPHTEILTKILNEIRNLPLQSSDEIKDVLSNYYTILENALNSRSNVEPLHILRSKKDLNYIDSIAQKIKNMDDKNVKIKISFEYELPNMHKTICEKLCNNLVNFGKARNPAVINDVNYINDPGKEKNKILSFLQNYRPNNIYPIMNKPDYFYSQNSDSLHSDPMALNMTILNILQRLSQPLSKQRGIGIAQPTQNFPPALHSPTETNFNSMQQSSRLFSGNPNVVSLQNLAALTQKANEISGVNLSKYLNTDPATHSLQNLSPPLLQSTDSSNKYPYQNLIPMPQSFTGSSNSYFFQNFTPLKNYLQNVVPLPQNPTEPENSYPIQTLPLQLQRFTGNAKDVEVLAKKLEGNYLSNENSQYHHNTQKQVHYNKNAVQYINKNNIVTPTKYENPKSDMFPNSWSQLNDVFTNNKYNNNEKLLQERLIQFYNQHKPLIPNLQLGTSTPDPAYLYQLNTNALPNINQYESRKLEMDPSSVQTTLDNYNQYLQSAKNLIYSQTNSGTGNYLLNQQIPYSYVKNYNQIATQSNTPNRPDLYSNLYYYSNPNLGLTNSVKGIQENYGVQFQDLLRLPAVSNDDKLNFISNKNGIIELTYKLTHTKPAVEPFYYVKYKLPYNVFLLNLKKLLTEKPNLRDNPRLLYKDLLIGSNITASSSNLKSMDKEELLKLVSTNGTLVTAKVLDANDTTASEQIKIVQNLNANLPLEDIVKTDANITKVADLTSKVSLLNYLRDRPNYLNDLQRKIAMSRYYLNSYNTQPNQNQHVQNPNYLANRLPTLGYNYLQNKQKYPFSSYGLNPLQKYTGYSG